MNHSRLVSYTVFGFLVGIFLIMLLGGCTRKTPTSEINQEIQNQVTELVDYANNNMVIDSDKQLLLSGAVHCAARANDMARTCEESIRAFKVEAAGWKLATTLMAIIAGLLGFLWVKK